MNKLKKESLAKYTSFGVGGSAENLIILDNAMDVLNLKEPIDWVLGYGTNSVISDEGLSGNTIMLRGGPDPTITDETTLIIDASTNWDRVVKFAIKNELWGIELMSGIPGNTGAALSGNIGAYGQTISHTFLWATIFDRKSGDKYKLNSDEVELSYRHSSIQDDKNFIILEVALKLSKSKTKDLDYASALKVATELGIEPTTLENRRKIILETRARAGSIYDESDPKREKTAGSFFKASVVDEATSRYLATFDESGKTVEQLLEQNKLQGGDSFRASAALVLLAAGYSRGQAWGDVRLHKKHVLKIENAGNATAQEIYDVAHEIFSNVKDKLGIELTAEAQFIGEFTKK